MNRRRRLLLATPGLAVLAGCLRRDPRIGLELVYEAAAPVVVGQLWFDDAPMLASRGAELHVSPHSTAHEARFTPSGAVVPAIVGARWRYEATDPVDEAAFQSLPDDRLPWREAEDSAALRAAMTPEALVLLRDDPDRHRLRLVLRFDRARLWLKWQVRQWR
ncbi:hypothetical protein M6I34_12825 [Burkholderiaceae bacterium FT117]|uniref:hypothetical protein n=1 Tax=Zeimonas sediminis TaxID=2944268 RepID=UPI002342EDDA|nr:hypothetical protein [Zeimonas sediminis]MCM5571395.1 hypothetical protein [Zeimonas sediminis]